MLRRWAERTKIIALLTVAVLSQATGNVLLSQGMKRIAGESGSSLVGWASALFQAVQTPSILLGTGFLIVFFVIFATALSRADLSFVLPAISSEVIVNVAFADHFLNETVSSSRWVGSILISIGVVLVLQSAPRTFVAEDEQENIADEAGP